MGTSRNDRSPNTPGWLAIRAVIGGDWPIERQSLELWRTAATDQEQVLVEELSHPVVAIASQLSQGAGVHEALDSYDDALDEHGPQSILADLARRSLAKAVAANTGPTGFATELFADVASYYTSRELPSYIGSRPGLRTTSAAIELKQRIRAIAREAASAVGDVRTDSAGWREYVVRVLNRLTRPSTPS